MPETNRSLTKVVKQGTYETPSILDKTKYPIVNGQKYFASDTGIFYEDIHNVRCAHVSIRNIDKTSGTTQAVDLSKFKNQFIISEDTDSTVSDRIYSIYYVTFDGTAVLIGNSGGGVEIPDPLPITRIRERGGGADGNPDSYSNIHFLTESNGTNIAGDIVIKPRDIGQGPPNVVKIINPDIDAGGW